MNGVAGEVGDLELEPALITGVHGGFDDQDAVTVLAVVAVLGVAIAAADAAQENGIALSDADEGVFSSLPLPDDAEHLLALVESHGFLA